MKRRGERQENRVIGRNRFHEVRSQDGEAVSRRTAAQEVRGSNPVGPMKEEDEEENRGRSQRRTTAWNWMKFGMRHLDTLMQLYAKGEVKGSIRYGDIDDYAT